MRAVLAATLANLRRLGEIGVRLTLHVVAHGGRRALRRLPWLRRRLAPSLSGPERFKALLERLGGTFIKFGQVLALQPDLLPRDYCEALFDLMDRVPPFGWEGVERVVREDLGQGPLEAFDRFERQPFGAASIGQVHVAWLGDRKLAVKVQRPDAQRVFGGDIRLMKLAVRSIGALRLRSLDWLARPLDEFVGWTREELDYRIEARYMDQLALNSRRQDGERVPRVVWERTSRRVLAADFLEGITLLDYMRGREAGDARTLAAAEAICFRPRRYAENILHNFLGDVFRHGLFHADLHPANLLILPDNVVGYVDFGISGAISRFARRQLMAAVLALTQGDLDDLASRFLAVSRVGGETDLDGFRRELERLGEKWYEGAGGRSRRRVSYSVMMIDMLLVCRRHQVRPHGETVRYLRSVVTADGLIARLAPEVDVDRALERFCADLFASESLRTAFSANRVIAAWAAGARLLESGAERAEGLLARNEPAGREDRHRNRGRRLPTAARAGRAAPALAGLLATSGWLLTREPASGSFGLDLFTAEVILLVAAATGLLASTCRWLFSSR